jgi:hypothetical protein
MSKEGSKRVEVVGLKDKKQITAVFGGSMSGEFLPVQFVYQGKTYMYKESSYSRFPQAVAVDLHTESLV